MGKFSVHEQDTNVITEPTTTEPTTVSTVNPLMELTFRFVSDYKREYDLAVQSASKHQKDVDKLTAERDEALAEQALVNAEIYKLSDTMGAFMMGKSTDETMLAVIRDLGRACKDEKHTGKWFADSLNSSSSSIRKLAQNAVDAANAKLTANGGGESAKVKEARGKYEYAYNSLPEDFRAIYDVRQTGLVK